MHPVSFDCDDCHVSFDIVISNSIICKTISFAKLLFACLTESFPSFFWDYVTNWHCCLLWLFQFMKQNPHDMQPGHCCSLLVQIQKCPWVSFLKRYLSNKTLGFHNCDGSHGVPHNSNLFILVASKLFLSVQVSVQ